MAGAVICFRLRAPARTMPSGAGLGVTMTTGLEIVQLAMLQPVTEVAADLEIRTMPGLPSEPVAVQVDIDERGRVVGLF